jgi:hypothetical protein
MVGASDDPGAVLIIGHKRCITLTINSFLTKREDLYPDLGASDYFWSGRDVSALRLSGSGPCHDESDPKADFY